MLTLKIKNIKGINWSKNHRIPEVNSTFQDFIDSGDISVGDIVTVENKEECGFPLDEGEYCLTFDKEDFFIEEPFSKKECIELFGKQFNY